MVKEKKETKKVETKVVTKDRYKILAEGVYKIFDRTPNGSIVSKEAHALLAKLK